ncbi:MAG: hypothetical protein HY036_09685 [Nitrospirae bacterium]|nr:hypothetical protein [Nitrospirota bacterium]MBI3352835.1 hypothetical protein [Nitrospirota bacterium]
MKTTTIKGVGGLNYIEIRNVPIRVSKDKEIDQIVMVNLGDLEKLVAIEIIKQKIPLHGQEVMFLRKVLGLSMEKFAGCLGLTSGSILKWERAKEKWLTPINEVAVRTLVAEKLKVDIPGKFSSLVGTENIPEKLSITWSQTGLKKKAA